MRATDLVMAALIAAAIGTVRPVQRSYAAAERALAASPGSAPSAGSSIASYLKRLRTRGDLSGAVLVARKGAIVLERGYGMADREDGVANTADTKFPVGGINLSLSLVAALRLEDKGVLHDRDLICSMLSSCSESWKSITLGMVLDGASGLGEMDWEGVSGQTTDDSLAQCSQSGAPSGPIVYYNCVVVVLGTIFEEVTGQPWATVMRRTVFTPAGMAHSGRTTDTFLPPARARDYRGSLPSDARVFNDYFQVYSTVRDILAYDNALFSGKLLSARSLKRLLAPRAPVSSPDAGIVNSSQAIQWRVGTLFGHRVTYLTGGTYNFNSIDLHFAKDRVTVVVLSNDGKNDVEGIGVQIASRVFGGSSRGGASRRPHHVNLPG